MARIAFLTQRMMRGYGVDVVISELASRLQSKSHQVLIVCTEADRTFDDAHIIVAGPHLSALRVLFSKLHPDVVLIHTAPFFDRLADLKKALPRIKWVAWEHGDPTPELFPRDRAAREREKCRKQDKCYPAVDALVCISAFVRRDIGFNGQAPVERIIHNGCDHAPDMGPKASTEVTQTESPLRVGTLARLGPGEAHYKGTADFLTLISRLRSRGIAIKPCFLGRGTAEEAASFIADGFEIHLNATDEEKWRYLRSLDVFVSCSRWEGFNLPLVEAQAVGTVGLALSLTAHPEVSEFVFPDMLALADRIVEYHGNRDELVRDSRRAYAHARKAFNWDQAAAELEDLVSTLLGNKDLHSRGQWTISPFTRLLVAAGRTRHLVRSKLLTRI